MTPPRQLRQQIRRLRAELPSDKRWRAAQQATTRMLSLRSFISANHIAGYFAFDGELDPKTILDRARELGKHIYMPVIVSGDQLMFAPYQPGDQLISNRFGIQEPDAPQASWLSPTQLDLVVTPLVAFNSQGNRMGMGAGFYDRSFAFLNCPTRPTRPCLLGLAYEIQKVTELPHRPWDVTLNAVVTETALYPEGASQWLA